MSLPPLAELLKSETDHIEWKTSAEKAADVLEPACAFGNDLSNSRMPGYVLFGVNKSGQVVGIDLGKKSRDEWSLQVSNYLSSTKILPHVSFDLTCIDHAGATVLVLTVAPYPTPPLVEVDRVAFVRKGTSTQRATFADVTRLRERRPENAIPFDSRVIPVADESDIDSPALLDTWQRQRTLDDSPDSFPAFPSWLADHRDLGRIVDNRFRPTVAAVLCHGLNPQSFIPEAVVEFARFGGDSIDSPVAYRKTITGPIGSQLDTIWALLSSQIAEVPTPASGIQTPYRPQYLLEVLKELARNMVQHRTYNESHSPSRIEWYSDRIEFSNPGGPIGAAAEGPMGDHSAYRNPAVTRELVTLGYVERLGRGIRRAYHLSDQAGYPRPEFETDGFTRAIVKAIT